MNNYISDKKTQRNEIRNRLQQSTLTYCYSSDQHIFQSIITLPEYQNASMIFCYISVKKEVDTRRLLKQAWLTANALLFRAALTKVSWNLMKSHHLTI